MRHNLNPAFAPEYDYVAIPAIGGISAGMNSNVGADNFLFKKNGEVVTGLHSSVGNDEFLSGLKSRNYMEVNSGVSVVSLGFKALGGFNTIGINVKSATSAALPYELFEFAKIGQVNGAPTSYNIKDTRVQSSNYLELAFGHSRNLGERFRVGAKVKYIAGVAYADARIDAIDVAMSADKWSVREQGEMFTTDAIDIQYKPNGEIDDISKGSFGVAGNGLGFDFGASYKLLDNLVLSASLTDVGFVAWKGSNASVNPDEFVYDGFHHLVAKRIPMEVRLSAVRATSWRKTCENWCGSRMRLEQAARSRCKRCSTLPENIQSSMIKSDSDCCGLHDSELFANGQR